MRKGLLKDNSNLLNAILKLGDLILISVSGVIAFYLSHAIDFYEMRGQHGIPVDYLIVIAIVVAILSVIFPLFSIYRVWRGASTLTEIKYLTIAWMMVAFTMMSLAFISKTGANYSRSWMSIWFIIGWFTLVASRVVLRLILRWLRSSGFNRRHIVIVGTGDHAVVVADRLRKSTWFGLEISALFESGASHQLPGWLAGKKIITEFSALREYVVQHSVDQVWISLPHSEEATIRKVIDVLDGVKTEIRYVPDIFEYQLLQHSLTEMAGIPVVNISYSAIDGANRYLKAIEDYVLSFVLLVCASPLMLLIAIGVKLSSRGPILYRQRRVGWNGKEFTMFKFRSMPVDAEKHTGPVWAKRDEMRATPFGSFLRKTSLDELPQLFNVLMGEMSLIGPRPERPVFVEKYKDEIPHYMKKHLVKAGLTGWAQVHGWRGNTSLHTRIEHDLYYIENWSLWLDIKIIIMTVFRGLIHKNAY